MRSPISIWPCNWPILQCTGELCTTQPRFNTLVMCLGHVVTWSGVQSLLCGTLPPKRPRNSDTQQIMVTGLQHHNQPAKPPIYISLMVVLACVAKG